MKYMGFDFDTDVELDELDGGQTNNEWRKTCSAEEFAEFLADIERNAVTYTGGGRFFTTKEDDIKYWVGWLKEKHIE